MKTIFNFSLVKRIFKKFTDHKSGIRAEVGIWHCESYMFSRQTGDVLLTSLPREVMNFSNAVLARYTIYCADFSEKDTPK